MEIPGISTKPGAAQQRATHYVFLLCGIAQAAWAPLVPYAKARVHANDRQFGLLLLCFGVGSIVSMPAMGALAGRFGCRRLIQITAIGVALSLASLSIASTTWLLAVSLVGFGAFIGSLDVVMNVQALLVEKHSSQHLMPSFHALYSAGGISGALVMSGLLWFNLPTATAAAVVVGVLAILLLLARGGLLPYGTDQTMGNRAFGWPGVYVLLLGALAFLTMLAEGSMLDWSAVYLVDNAGMLAQHAGIGFAAFSIAMTVSRLSGSKVIARLGRTRVITLGALLAAAGFLLAAISANPAIAISAFALIGFGVANLVPLFFTLASESKGGLGLNVSFVTTLGYSGVLAGPAVIGFVVHATAFSVAFGGVALLLCLVATLSRVATRSSQ